MKKARKSKVGLVVALVATLSCSSMVAVSQLCKMNGNGVITASAATTSDISTQSMTSAEIAAAWAAAVQQSVEGEKVTFILEDNWTAEESTEYTTSFGTDADDATVSAFSNGRIFVPAAADILLDLNGYTISRNLSEAIADGSVFYVEGSLEIIDTSDEGEGGDGVITGGNSTGYGGGIVVENGTLKLTSGEISGNIITANCGGGVYLHGAATTFTMDGGLISDNTAIYGGGGIYISGANFIMNGGEISGHNVSNEGGGIFADNGTFEMNDGLITNNVTTKSDGMGGGVRMAYTRSRFTMNGGEISGNTSNSGGGVRLYQCTSVMNGGKISDNTCGRGGLYLDGGSGSFTLNNGEISGNISSGNRGGGVYCSGSTTIFTMNGGKIQGNRLTSGGAYGAGLHSESGKVYINGGEIYENVAEGSGYAGGISIPNGELIITDGKIYNNTAYVAGGVFAFGSTKFTMTGGEISGNTATNDAGGVFTNTSSSGGSPTITISGGVIKGNTAAASGGGVYVMGGATVFNFNGGEVSENTANSTGYGGGGMYVHSGTVNMNGGVFKGNTAGYRGGGLYQIGGTVNMNGGTITGNSAPYAGGVYIRYNNFYLKGGVVYGNTQSDNGAANNLGFLDSNCLIKVAGRLASDTYIGVMNTGARPVTSGYTSSGNKIGKESNYFINDNPDFVLTNNGTEVTLAATTSTPAAKTDFDWSYTSYDSNFQNPQTVTVDDGTFTAKATYTGGAFVFDGVKDGKATVIDENGKAVTPTNVGKYHLAVLNADKAKYNNPVFTFEILPADISELGLTVTADTVTYTGSALTTSVRVINSGVLLVEGTDYTVSYKNNKNAGEGTVVINAIGNYKGTIEKTFTIEKAKLGVRWGLDTATYTGSTIGIPVYAEGLFGSDSVTLTVTYTQDGNAVDPVNVGKYVAKVTLDNANYKLSTTYENYFYIVEKKVDAVWSETSFVYSGNDNTVTAYFMDGDTRVDLVVTLAETVEAGRYTATAALPAGYENFVLTEGTASVTYTIEKAEVEAVWDEYEFKYGEDVEIEVTLTGLNGEDLSGDLTYTYYDGEGNKLSALPVDAGTYKVVISLTNGNYVLKGKTEKTFNITKQKIVVTVDEDFTAEYDGTSKTPLISVADEDGDEIEYTINYALVDDDGNVLKDLGTTEPVSAGKYVLTVVSDNANVEQTAFKAEFEIQAKTISVVWNFGDKAMQIDDVYTYLYDGTAHQPTATADGIELTVTGTGKSVRNGYKATASIDDANYILDGDLEVTFNVIQSKVSNVRWYEYGSTQPVAQGVKPSYEYIFVYGQEEGAKLSAYGVLTAADDSIGWNVSEESLIKLNVTYSTYYEGFWAIGKYTASATLSSADKTNDACYMPLGINDTLEFEVTAITHSASVATILWVVVNEDGTHTLASNYKFIYNGAAQKPVAIRVLSNSYDPYDPDPDTFEYLSVSGAQVNAGTYYAYIIPEGKYEIKAEDAEFKFVISPIEIEIKWEDKNDEGKVVVAYNGSEQTPKANIVGDNDLGCVITVDGYVEAGSYTAKAKVGDNFKVKGDDTVTFVIEQYTLSPDSVVWASDGEEREGSDGKKYFVWKYDGNTHTPTASLKVTFGDEEITIKLSVTGSATTAGTHYAYATLESSDPANANFQMEVARIRLDIVQNSVTVVWEDASDDGEIIFTYDGNAHAPKAYYLSNGEKVYLNVVGSGTDAGQYVAFITDSLDITNGATKVFTVKAQQLKADWDKTEVSYNGEQRTPSVAFTNLETEETVTLKLGVDYLVSGAVNAGTYTSEITLINGNYAIGDTSGTHAFTITKKTVTIIWYGVDESEQDFDWYYDGEEHAPTFKASIDGLDIVIKGAETQVGTYTAVALLDNDNYIISNPEKEFTIKGNTISVIWTDENGDDLESFVWEYDANGEPRAPKAYIALADGTKGGELTVVGKAIYAGEYTAYAILPANCEWADGEKGECKFTISPRICHT